MPARQPRRPAMIAGDRRTVAVAACTAALYLLASQYTTWLNDPSNLGAGYWPGAGISLAALLLTPRRSWPLILLAVGVAELVGDLAAGYSLTVSLWWTAANVLEPVLAAMLLTRLGAFRLDGVRSAVRFVLVAVLLAPMVAALLGAVGSLQHGNPGPYLLVVARWLVGDGLGVLTVTPAILVLRSQPARRALLDRAGISGMTALVLVSVLVFHPWTDSWDVTLPYLVLPPMIWMALRHGLAGTAAAILVLTQIAIAATSVGYGPFAHAGDGAGQAVWLVQLYLLTTATTGLLLGAQATESLRHRREATDQGRRADHETLLRTLGHAALVASDLDQLCAEVVDLLQPAVAPARIRVEGGSCRLHLDERTGTAPADAPLLLDAAQWLHDQAHARMRAQQALAASNQQLRQALDTKDRFITIVSHELRTPLTPIIGFSELLLDRLDDGDDLSRSGLQAINRQGQHLLGLVDRLLHVADLTQQGADPTPASVSVIATANAVVADLAAPVEITTHGRDLAWVDPLHLQQILTDLLSNAMRYGAPPINLTIDGRTDRLTIVVEDRGPGIDPSFTGRMFELFAQPDTNDRRRSDGLGIGLAVVKLLVEANCGTISHQPTGHGTRFVVTLPTAPDSRQPQVHDVILYRQPHQLSAELAGTLRAGLQAEVPTLVIATPQVRAGLDHALRTVGIDLDDARARDRYVEYDAEPLLDTILHDGRPVPSRLHELMHDLQERFGDTRPQIYGEMVAVAMGRGMVVAALQLEDLWNDLAEQYRFDLYCSYHAGCFTGPDGELAAATIRHQHRTTIDLGATAPGRW